MIKSYPKFPYIYKPRAEQKYPKLSEVVISAISKYYHQHLP